MMKKSCQTCRYFVPYFRLCTTMIGAEHYRRVRHGYCLALKMVLIPRNPSDCRLWQKPEMICQIK